jgi:hypothetical protein
MSRSKLQKLCDISDSFCDLLSKIGLGRRGNNWITLKRRLISDEIDVSTLEANRAASKKERSTNQIPLEGILIDGSTYSRGNLKKRLLKLGLLQNKCYNCDHLPKWDNKPLVMVLDHINGKNDDNRIENLRLLCPNCNSQTKTFSGRNVKYSVKIRLCSCGNRIGKKSLMCKDCSNKAPKPNRRKVERPLKEDLQKMLWKKPTVQIAKDYGVSDRAIGKWAKSYGLAKPPRGYWGFQAS